MGGGIMRRMAPIIIRCAGFLVHGRCLCLMAIRTIRAVRCGRNRDTRRAVRTICISRIVICSSHAVRARCRAGRTVRAGRYAGRGAGRCAGRIGLGWRKLARRARHRGGEIYARGEAAIDPGGDREQDEGDSKGAVNPVPAAGNMMQKPRRQRGICSLILVCHESEGGQAATVTRRTDIEGDARVGKEKMGDDDDVGCLARPARTIS